MPSSPGCVPASVMAVMIRNTLACWRRRLLPLAAAWAAGVACQPSAATAETEFRVVDEAAQEAPLDIGVALGADMSSQVEPAAYDEDEPTEEAPAEDERAEGTANTDPLADGEEAESGGEDAYDEVAEEVEVIQLEQQADQGAPEILEGQPALDVQEEVAPVAETIGPRYYRPITDVTVDAALPPGLLPEQAAIEDPHSADPATPEFIDARLVGGWAENNFRWSATSFCHGPLYFEEVNLERYGYGRRTCVQPFVSGAHFFLTIPTLPYQMTAYPPRECIYTLGHYRPGSRVPYRRHRLPWDARAAAVEAGVVVGLVFLIP